MSAQDRLARMLFIVPYVLHKDGVPVAELAAKLKVPKATLEADLSLLSLVGRPPLTPDHLIDIYIEDDVVYVELAQSLTRPIRLTRPELRALVLAVRLVGDLGGVGSELEQLVERIAGCLASDDAAAVRELWQRVHVGAEGAPIVTLLRDALAHNRELDVDYYSASSDHTRSYRLQPLALLNHMGNEYLLAQEASAEKLFRIERMSAARLRDDVFTPPANLDLERFRRRDLVRSGDGDAQVWFSERVKRAVAERFDPDRVSAAPDGGVYVRLETSAPVWLSRWVLPFGEDAELLGPNTERERLAELCADAARAYGEGTVAR